MTTLSVQFADSSEATIIAYFGCPQDVSIYPNQGEISVSDQRWLTYLGTLPRSMAQLLPGGGK